MLDKVKIVYKNKGETPLDCIKKFKEKNEELRSLPITYAGRLDPLAEGVLVLLIGDECNKKDEYLMLSKEYEVEILFGFKTDTYDLMGKIITTSEVIFKTSSDEEPDYENFNISLARILKNFIGKIKQSYPPYSSRTVKGKPLFMWARQGRLSEVEIPTHDVFIESIDLFGEDFITGESLLEKIKNDVSLVKGDFRQNEIINCWEEVLRNKKEEKYKIIKLRIKCGSGVYVRVLANDIGEELGIPSLALKIIRTQLGKYKINL